MLTWLPAASITDNENKKEINPIRVRSCDDASHSLEETYPHAESWDKIAWVVTTMIQSNLRLSFGTGCARSLGYHKRQRKHCQHLPLQPLQGAQLLPNQHFQGASPLRITGMQIPLILHPYNYKKACGMNGTGRVADLVVWTFPLEII